MSDREMTSHVFTITSLPIITRHIGELWHMNYSLANMDWSIFQESERIEQVTITEYLATIREMFQEQRFSQYFLE